MGTKNAFYVCFILFCASIIAQPYDNALAAAHVTDKQWKQLTKDKAFGYSTEKEMKEPRKTPPAENFFSRLFAGLISFFSSSVGKTVVWIIFFSIIAYTIFRIIINEKTRFFRRREKITEEVAEPTGVPTEDLLQTNWEEYMRKAQTDGNIRLAIRYTYMRTLQLLQKRQLINYRSDKTNYEYYYELSNSNHRVPFQQLTRQYEYSWYGNYEVQPDAFTNYMQTFDNLKSQLYQ
jgi:hypothetical protein